MRIYFITIAIILILCLLAEKYDYSYSNEFTEGKVKHSKTANFFFFVACCWLIIVASNRYNVGTDFGAYFRYYYDFIYRVVYNFKLTNEPGFGIIAKLATLIHDDGTTVLTFVSIITIGLALITIKNNTNRLTIATLLFVFLECWHYSFNAVRQCLAVTIVFCGYKYLKNGNFFRYIICILIAYLFHKSAIVMIAVYFVIRREVNKRNVFLFIAGSIIVLLSYDYLFAFQSEILGDGIVQYSYVTSAVNSLRVLANVAPAIFFLIFRSKNKDANSDFYMNILLIHAAVAVASSNSAYLSRMTIYTAPFVCIAIPELLKTISDTNRRIITPVILVLFGIFWIYDISINPSLNNFTFIWEVM